MAPSIHPPCTPSASCQPPRCHPTPPPCANPESCIAETIRKNVKPCASAVSILATRSRTKCAECNRLKTAAVSNAPAAAADSKHKRGKKGQQQVQEISTTDPTTKAIKEYLDRKSLEAKLRREDRLMGTHKYTEYRRKMGTPRSETDCCPGHGHRGRLSRGAAAPAPVGKPKRGGEKKKGGCTIL